MTYYHVADEPRASRVDPDYAPDRYADAGPITYGRAGPSKSFHCGGMAKGHVYWEHQGERSNCSICKANN